MLDFDRSSVRSENRGPGEDQLRSTPKVRENLDRPKVEVSLWSACEGAMRTQVSGIYKIVRLLPSGPMGSRSLGSEAWTVGSVCLTSTKPKKPKRMGQRSGGANGSVRYQEG